MFINTKSSNYKTRLRDGRYFLISDSYQLDDSEFLIIIDSQPILSNKIPALLRKRVSEITFFIKEDNRYVKTSIDSEDALYIKLLITNTPLNSFNVLFGKYLVED